MALGRRKRAMLCSIPHNRFYLVEWDMNEVIRLALLSDPALRLWLILKGISWELGQCDPTDEWLADWMGGVSVDTVRRSRRELTELHLLLERTGEGRRWLVPLPVSRGLAGKLPRSVAAEVETAVKDLAGRIQEELEAGKHELPPQAGGVNSISLGGSLKHHQHFINSKENDVDAVGVDAVGGEGGTQHERAALAAYLERLGAFPRVARRLAPKLLARMGFDEARAVAQAHRIALLESPPAKKDVHRDDILRLWVSRLDQGARAAPKALAQAWLILDAEMQPDADLWEHAGQEAKDATPPVESEPANEDGSDPPDGEEESAEAGLPQIECMYLGEQRVFTVAEMWQRSLECLRGQMTRDTFTILLSGTRGVDLTGDGALVVEVASERAVELLSQRLSKVVARAVGSVAGREMAVEFRTRNLSP